MNFGKNQEIALIALLKTIPEIQSCWIRISPTKIELSEINNTDFLLNLKSPRTIIDPSLESNYYSGLIQTGLKEESVIKILNLCSDLNKKAYRLYSRLRKSRCLKDSSIFNAVSKYEANDDNK